jgi:hypothetical protein
MAEVTTILDIRELLRALSLRRRRSLRRAATRCGDLFAKRSQIDACCPVWKTGMCIKTS